MNNYDKLIQATIVWKTEGPTDMLALGSLGLPAGHVAICNPFGAGENPLAGDGHKEWMLQVLRQKTVYVVHDCDRPGQEGAMCDTTRGSVRRLGWAPAIAIYASEVRNVILPYEMQETHGKDLRDWINDRIAVHTAAGLADQEARRTIYDELLALAQTSQLVPNPDPERSRVLSVDAATHEAIPAAPHTPEEGSQEGATADELLAPEDVETDPASETEFYLEAVDSPHRLARINLDAYRNNLGREIRYWNETWFLWKSGQYVEITRDHIECRLNLAIKAEFNRVWSEEMAEYKDWQKSDEYEPAQDKGPPRVRKVTSALVRNVLEATKAMCFISATIPMHSWLDDRLPGETCVSVANGMLNMSRLLGGAESIEDVLTPHTPAWFSTSRLPYPYSPDVGCETWRKFLSDVFNGDNESILALQKWFGYLLTPDMSMHKVLFVIGPTRSGKGTIISVLRDLLGQEAIATPTLSSLGQPFGLASLVGKTAAIIADARMPSKADESIITERLLNITGGDPVSISRKHKTDMDNFKLSCRFTLFSNLLPRLRDASAVFVNRCIFLAMPNSYLGREDMGLQARLREEMTGILNWAIIGRALLDEGRNAAGEIVQQERGRIAQPMSGVKLLTELQSIMSPVSMFLTDCCESGDTYSVATKDLFNAWSAWCEENDVTHAGDVQSFARKLKAVATHIDTERRTISSIGERARVFTGIKIRG